MTVERIVVDTNVLISAALRPSGTPRAVVDTIRQARGVLLFANETIKELHSRLFRTKFDRYVSRTIRTQFLVQLLGVSERVSITGAKLGCADPNDDKFLETAMVGQADYLITGDRHLPDMTPYRGVPILTPASFLNSLAAPS
ncbi:MAG: putative toxin-antitoxin system toxin component, PIN family [Spirochaetaceae bacterium]|nr:putative toxin-antitoxin system toxin component, PIN family [Spirochaetaceae bacterium]